MGIAEIIPGVSGGTIAFITGIYQTLLDSIKAINLGLLKDLLRFDLKSVWIKVNGPFLFWLFGGMAVGILSGVFGVSYLLDNYPEILWGLFFGLILASVPLMMSQLDKRTFASTALFFLGTLIAYGITTLSPAAGSTNLLYVFFAGVIAISALVLPGVSGSFMLLLMGLYTTIYPALKSFLSGPNFSEFILLGVFALGCLTGLMFFSRLVSMIFEKHKYETIALLSGFMLGSLNKIWPWRNVTSLLNKDTGQTVDVTGLVPQSYMMENGGEDRFKIFSEANVLPSDYLGDPKLLATVIAFFLGLLIIYLFHRSGLMTKADKA